MYERGSDGWVIERLLLDETERQVNESSRHPDCSALSDNGIPLSSFHVK